MKSIKKVLHMGGLVLLAAVLFSCGEKKEQAEEKDLGASSPAAMAKQSGPATLPAQYQRPAYMVGEELQVTENSAEDDAVTLKVGATIRSTTGPQPLWDIMKRLVGMKDMNVSWASDVDRNVLVDVDIQANDDFYKAIDHLLRQVDYYHEIVDNTVVVKYKETRQYQLSMPYIKQLFSTAVGGNMLGNNKNFDDKTLEGTVKLASRDNEYDFWKNIDENLNKILKVWTTETVTDATASADESAAAKNGKSSKDKKTKNTKKEKNTVDADEGVSSEEPIKTTTTRQVSESENVYLLDKSIGLITVTAPRPLLEKVDAYINTLKKHLYKQINIEAKIIEVQLTESSSIGINWDNVLKNFNMSGTVEFGSTALGGQVWPYIYSEKGVKTTTNDDGSYQDTYDPTRFVSRVLMNSVSFDVFLNALKGEGQTSVLSNPKISLMNGQAAMLTVGQNVTYIDTVEAEVDDDGNIAYTIETDDILSGIGMALTATIVNGNEIIMNLTPVTSELDGEIPYKDFGSDGVVVGLPVVNIREMSTTVKVKDGETLVIGGLIDEAKQKTGSFAPILGDIPVIKYLFGYEETNNNKRELIILLKPVIM